jgi:hypothetical protein
MKTVELPSGQIIDLSGFISLKPSTQIESGDTTHSNYELILAGYDRPLDLSQSDAATLKQFLTNQSTLQQGFPVYSESEQRQRNQIAMAKLQKIIYRDRQQHSSIEAEQFFEDLQQIMDENRPVGKKLFSE